MLLQVETILDERKRVGTLAHVIGDVDMATAETLSDALVAASSRNSGVFIVSLERCSYMDSTAIGVLVRFRKTLGSRLFIMAPIHATVNHLLEICGLTDYLGVIREIPRNFETLETNRT